MSGAVYVGLIIGAIFWGMIPFSLLAALIAILAVFELEKICSGFSWKDLPLRLIDSAAAVSAVFFWTRHSLAAVWLGLFICRMVLELYTKNQDPIRSLSLSLMSQLYIALPLAVMTYIASFWGLHFVLAVFLMIWINDTGAFLVGSLCGRHRLFLRISPKKSWEGFFGGLLFNIVAGWLFAVCGHGFWQVDWPVIVWILLAVLITVFSTWGDLIESLIKRSLGIKDSGNLIPGHGGILDRIDSLLIVFPALLLFLLIL